MQCRINANRGPWQLFAQAPLRETKTYHSQPLESIRHDGNISSRYQYGPFLFFVAEIMSNYLTTDGLKKISLLPEARSICHIATWLIRHCLHGL